MENKDTATNNNISTNKNPNSGENTSTNKDYILICSILREWFNAGLIKKEELSKMNDYLKEKYEPMSDRLYDLVM